MPKHNHQTSVKFDPVTLERIKHAANKSALPVSAWIRMAVRYQLNQENTKGEISQLREELASSFSRILDHCRSLSNAQQAAIALVDTLTKYILSVSPEPGAEAQKIGRQRYERFLKSVASALQGDILRLFGGIEGGKKPN